ncbi:T9SS type A sorting domain-containing protein [Flavobacterium sp. xlx-214]|uniref:T9SS type A sorting domain-containing protein n=1 Tax=unclassified Flavobacterium TaxID=196869 RepID=UPI0013D44E41|nr:MULTISPECIES: T9SS type A sorting domain-containing protein [unclassified Flavobacterium]MBA5792201.1 T9SS type A sorting domain-containing protein [Flavobacterium sp. xlx-221]QMI84444.1 T9SS type A sorting domain-containing protein [Flavobacterium sp. xlx-214]
MKLFSILNKYIFVLFVLLVNNTTNSQVLYTENFESYPIGNIGTDVTGQIPGVGGLYTVSAIDTKSSAVTSNTEFQIVTEPSRGKVAQIDPMAIKGEWYRVLYRTDLKTIWQQRTPGNNVLKITFDMYCGASGNNGTGLASTNMELQSDKGTLASIGYHPYHQYIGVDVKPEFKRIKGALGPFLFYANGQPLKVPANSWVTFEVYVDYNNSMVYFSIPALNYTFAKNTGTYILDLNGIEHDDNPVWLSFDTGKFTDVIPIQPNTPKIDNINFSAQNTVPTVNLSAESVLATQFNVYPNPATTIVNINSAENKHVSKIAVYDVAGKLLSTQSFNNETNLQLNTESLASGTYMLHIETNEGTAVKKLVKK